MDDKMLKQLGLSAADFEDHAFEDEYVASHTDTPGDGLLLAGHAVTDPHFAPPLPPHQVRRHGSRSCS